MSSLDNPAATATSTPAQPRSPLENTPHPRNGAMLPVASPAAPPAPTYPLVAVAPTIPPAVAGAPTFSSLWHAFRRRWLVASLAAIVAALALLLVVLEFVPGHYTAETRVRVNPQPFPDEGGFDFYTFRISQDAIIKSSHILNEALNQAGVPNSVGWLATQIKVDFTLGEVMRLTLMNSDAEEARKLANAVAKAYIGQAEKDAKLQRRAELERMEENLRELQRSLHDKEVLLARLRNERKLDDPEVTRMRYDAAFRRVEEGRKELALLNGKEFDLKGELKSLDKEEKDLPTRPIADVEVDVLLKGDPQMERLQKFAIDQAALIAHLREILANNPIARAELAAAQGKLQDLQRQMTEYRQKHLPRVREQIGVQIKLKRVDAQSKLGTLQDKRQAVEQDVQRLEGEAQKLRRQPLPPEIQKLERDVEMGKKTMEQEAGKLALRKLMPLNNRLSLLQEAELPSTVDRSRQLKFGGAAFLGAFCVMLFGVTMWEFRHRKLATPDEISVGLGMNLLGTLPLLPTRLRGGGQTDPWWQNRLAEAVDAVRTFMLHSARADELRVVMVTSAANGEGKTSLASQLAASLARAWRKTLLVDGDLRHPAAHRLFDKPLEPGLCEVLRGEAPLTEVVQSTPIGRLWLLSAGRWDSHAVQALAQDGVRALFAELKEQYDFVVVDSGPVLPTADSLQLGQHVDGVVLSVLRDVSQAPSVHRAQQKLQHLGVRILGTVFIGDPEKGPPGKATPVGPGA